MCFIPPQPTAMAVGQPLKALVTWVSGGQEKFRSLTDNLFIYNSRICEFIIGVRVGVSVRVTEYSGGQQLGFRRATVRIQEGNER